MSHVHSLAPIECHRATRGGFPASLSHLIPLPLPPRTAPSPAAAAAAPPTPIVCHALCRREGRGRVGGPHPGQSSCWATCNRHPSDADSTTAGHVYGANQTPFSPHRCCCCRRRCCRRLFRLPRLWCPSSSSPHHIQQQQQKQQQQSLPVHHDSGILGPEPAPCLGQRRSWATKPAVHGRGTIACLFVDLEQPGTAIAAAALCPTRSAAPPSHAAAAATAPVAAAPVAAAAAAAAAVARDPTT